MFKKLLTLSAKYSFFALRANSPFWCSALQSSVIINREYWNHLNFSKERTIEETETRLLLAPFIAMVLEKGEMVNASSPFFRIEYILETLRIGCVIIQKNSKMILLSCFIIDNKKNNLPPA